MDLELTAKSRLVQTFKFLKELNELRNPVPRDTSAYAQVMRLDSWPKHPCIVVRRGDRQDEEDTGAGEVEMEPLVQIQREADPLPEATGGARWLAEAGLAVG